MSLDTHVLGEDSATNAEHLQVTEHLHQFTNMECGFFNDQQQKKISEVQKI